MITNAWYFSVFGEDFFNDNLDDIQTFYLKRYTGEEAKVRVMTSYNIQNLLYDTSVPTTAAYRTTSGAPTVGIIFGNGENPIVTKDDYCLCGTRITTFTAIKSNSTVAIDGNKYTLKTLITLTNTSSEEITITEVGLLGYNLSVLTSETRYYNTSILLDHTVLDNPVTIPAGGMGQVEYTITFNPPTA